MIAFMVVRFVYTCITAIHGGSGWRRSSASISSIIILCGVPVSSDHQCSRHPPHIAFASLRSDFKTLLIFTKFDWMAASGASCRCAYSSKKALMFFRACLSEMGLLSPTCMRKGGRTASLIVVYGFSTAKIGVRDALTVRFLNRDYESRLWVSRGKPTQPSVESLRLQSYMYLRFCACGYMHFSSHGTSRKVIKTDRENEL